MFSIGKPLQGPYLPNSESRSVSSTSLSLMDTAMPDPPASVWSSGIFQAWHRHQFQCQSHPRTPINLFEDAVVVFFYGCDGITGLSFHHRIPSSLHRKCPLEEILSFCSHNIVVGDGFTMAEPVWLPLTHLV